MGDRERTAKRTTRATDSRTNSDSVSIAVEKQFIEGLSKLSFRSAIELNFKYAQTAFPASAYNAD